MARKIIRLKSVDSTNTYIKNLPISERVDGLVVVADKQTKGRGRLGRSFMSDGKGLYVSYVVKPDCSIKDSLIITSTVAVAVARAIEKVSHISVGIKWVNDIVYGGRKLAGVLTEAVNVSGDKAECYVIGIGINVNETEDDFGAELKDKAISLKTILKRDFDKEELLSALIEELDEMEATFLSKRDMYYGEYVQRSVMFDRNVVLSDTAKRRSGKVVGIDRDYALKVESDNGEITKVISGDISVDGIYGIDL